MLEKQSNFGKYHQIWTILKKVLPKIGIRSPKSMYKFQSQD
jgi:hypothetical protein